jgi:hypothetical protein
MDSFASRLSIGDQILLGHSFSLGQRELGFSPVVLIGCQVSFPVPFPLKRENWEEFQVMEFFQVRKAIVTSQCQGKRQKRCP